MVRKYALAIHDLRVSADVEVIAKLQWLITTFQKPLTVHLVFDDSLANHPQLLQYISQQMAEEKIEIVFHGLTHQCPKNVSKFWAFYHKYQAEYLNDTDTLRQQTQIRFTEQIKILGRNLGICPPCWLYTVKNQQFLKALKPVFFETLLRIHNSKKSFFSPVISLGSPNKNELLFLRMLGGLMFYVSLLLSKPIVRVAVHTCDLEIENSIDFFKQITCKLNNRKFQAVLMNNLI